MQIVIIDDDRLTRTVLRKFLQNSGHTIVGEAATGEEGIRVVLETKPALLLLELELPDMNGVEVAQRLMDLVPMPVVVVSAHEEEELFARVMDAGVHAYLTKPFNGPDLGRAIAIARARFDDAMAIRRLQEAAEQRATRLAVAHEIVQRLADMSLNDALVPQELLQDVTRRIQGDFGYYAAKIGLIEDDNVVLIAAAGPDVIEEMLGTRQRIGTDGIIGWVAGSGQPLLAPDVSTEPRYGPCPWCTRTRGELAVPFKMRDHAFGVLDVQSAEIDVLGREDLQVLELLAGSLATILENAGLVRELQERGRQLAEANRQLVETQEQLVRSERLAAIGETVAAVQHEINNPLTSVLGNVQWLRRQEELSPETARLLQVIEREAERIRSVMRRLQMADDRLTSYVGDAKMIDIGDDDTERTDANVNPKSSLVGENET